MMPASEPEQEPKVPQTDFVDALIVFTQRVDVDPAAAREYIRVRVHEVRRKAQKAMAMDSSPRAKILAWVDSIWLTALSGVVGSVSVVPTERDRIQRLAGQVAVHLDALLVHLQPPIDVSGTRRERMNAESVF